MSHSFSACFRLDTGIAEVHLHFGLTKIVTGSDEYGPFLGPRWPDECVARCVHPCPGMHKVLMSEEVEYLANACAREALRVAGPGNRGLVSPLPLPGDWESLRYLLGVRRNSDLPRQWVELFEDTYTSAIKRGV